MCRESLFKFSRLSEESYPNFLIMWSLHTVGPKDKLYIISIVCLTKWCIVYGLYTHSWVTSRDQMNFSQYKVIEVFKVPPLPMQKEIAMPLQLRRVLATQLYIHSIIDTHTLDSWFLSFWSWFNRGWFSYVENRKSFQNICTVYILYVCAACQLLQFMHSCIIVVTSSPHHTHTHGHSLTHSLTLVQLLPTYTCKYISYMYISSGNNDGSADCSWESGTYTGPHLCQHALRTHGARNYICSGGWGCVWGYCHSALLLHKTGPLQIRPRTEQHEDPVIVRSPFSLFA